MKHSVPHDLGAEKARQVAEAAFASYKAKFENYRPEATWVSDTRAEIRFTIKGMALSGIMEVTASTIDMDLDVPFLFRPFRGTAMALIEKEIGAWITKAKAGEI
jgi:hypothetical protein